MTRSLLSNDDLLETGAEKARWQVLDGRPRDGLVKLFDRGTKQDVYRPFVEISLAVADGSIKVLRRGLPLIGAPRQPDPELTSCLTKAMEALRHVKAAQAKYRVSFNQAYEIVKRKHDGVALIFPLLQSRATLYRYSKAQRNDLPLLRGHKNKGNRIPRYDERIVDLIVSAVNRLFLTPDSSWSLLDIVQYVNDEVHSTQLLHWETRISKAFIRKTIYENNSVDPEIERMNPRLVAAAKSIARNRIIVANPFDRVEQDAVHLPFVVDTPHGVTNDLYLIHAIDCSTGLVLGWYLMIGPPSESHGLKCVESILYSKRSAFERLRFECSLDIFGVPRLIVFDNGPENKGQRMSRLSRLGIDTLHCKSRHAHGKPFIERLNRSLKEALQILKGCTRKDGKDGKRDPVSLGDELMSMEELERWIVRWYYESWANTELKRHLRSDFNDALKLGKTPKARFMRMNELGYPMPLSPPRSSWLMALYAHTEKTLSRKSGIFIDGLYYRGDALTYLLKRFGETPVKVLFNPEDYRQIFVFEADDKPLIPLTEEFVDGTTPAYSFADMRAKLKAEGRTNAEDPDKFRFRRDVQAAAAGAATQKKTASRSEKNRKVVQSSRESEARKRGSDMPLKDGPSFVDQNSKRGPVSFTFDDVEPLDLINRTTGKETR
jgi:putative transposase